jgi:heme oxygenase
MYYKKYFVNKLYMYMDMSKRQSLQVHSSVRISKKKTDRETNSQFTLNYNNVINLINQFKEKMRALPMLKT